MGKIIAVILAAATLAALQSPAFAQDPAKYTFASAQSNKNMRVVPGDEGTGVIYFYIIDGNRITHITLDVSRAPEDWQVEIQPPLHEIQVEIGGRIVAVTENLHVEPSTLLSEEPADVPEGMVNITVPNRGYALAKAASIVVHVPQSAEIGTVGEITIAAEAEWLGQTGAAAIKQARDFGFSVEVVPEAAGGEERILEDDAAETDDSPSMQWAWLVAIIATLVVLTIFAPRVLRRMRG